MLTKLILQTPISERYLFEMAGKKKVKKNVGSRGSRKRMKEEQKVSRNIQETREVLQEVKSRSDMVSGQAWEAKWQTERWLLEKQPGMEKRRAARNEMKARYLEYLSLKDMPAPRVERRKEWSPPPLKYMARVKQPGT